MTLDTKPTPKFLQASESARQTGRPGRYDWYKLTVEQVKFLRTILDLPRSTRTVLRELEVRPFTFSKWLENKYFRSRLSQTMQFLKAERRLNTQLTGSRASQEISKFVENAPDALGPDRVAHMPAIVKQAELRVPRRTSARQQHDPLPADMSEVQAAELLRDFDRAEEGENAQAANPNDQQTTGVQ